MTDALPLLAHAGAGATWQALLATISIGLLIVLVLVLAGRITLSEPGDLILPLAAVAIVSSLAPIWDATLSDYVGWAVPAGAMILLGLVLAASTPLELTWVAPLTLVVVVLGALGSWAFGQDINRAWHPLDGALPLADDGTITIASPTDQSTVEAGTVPLVLEVTGATVGPGDLTEDDAPSDPEELGTVRIFVDGKVFTEDPAETCTAASPCTTLTYDMTLEPGAHTIIVEFLRWDGVPLAPTIFDRVVVEAAG